VYIADEAFFTGTAAEVTPIREVDNRAIGAGKRGPVTQKLQAAYWALVKGESSQYPQWLSHVDGAAARPANDKFTLPNGGAGGKAIYTLVEGGMRTITGTVGKRDGDEYELRAEEATLTVEKMALDEKGFPQPTGETETLEADSLVLALGQDVDLSLLEGVPGLEVKDGVVQVGPDMMTGRPGVFAGGDMVPAERTVTVAVGHGKKAARHIDAWLRGAAYAPPPKHEPARFEFLNPWYYSDAPKTVRPMLDVIRRQSTFEEVTQGLDESTALYEARRCLSCGNCFECDNCYGVCPDNAVVKLGPGKRFRFNYDYCKGCGLCAAECPCGAIRIVPEEI